MSDHDQKNNPTIDRRLLMTLLALSAAAPVPTVAGPATGVDHAAHSPQMSGQRPKVAMLVYPDMVMLDLVGPSTCLKIAQCDIEFVWKTRSPCMTDAGIAVTPTMTFAECPRDLDVLFVPGGIIGTTACMEDPEVLAFLADRGQRARYVTSVCTGSLVLAAAGLLKGYRSTSLWAVTPLLADMGAVPSMDRVVVDRNRMSGGGVTAGLDFGLTLVAALRDEETAKRVQLFLQYAPEPPFHAGMPDGAGPELTAKVLKAREGMDAGAKRAAKAAGKRMGVLV